MDLPDQLGIIPQPFPDPLITTYLREIITIPGEWKVNRDPEEANVYFIEWQPNRKEGIVPEVHPEVYPEVVEDTLGILVPPIGGIAPFNIKGNTLLRREVLQMEV